MRYQILKQAYQKPREAAQMAKELNDKYVKQGKDLEAYIEVDYKVMVKVKLK